MNPTGGQAPNKRARSIEHENSQVHEKLLDNIPLYLKMKMLEEAYDPKTCKEHAFACSSLRGQCDWKRLVEKYRLSDGDVLPMCQNANKTCSKQDDKKDCMRFNKQCCNETAAIRAADELGEEARLILDAYPFLRNNKNVAIAVVSNDGTALQYVHEDLKADKDVVLASVRNDPSSLIDARGPVKRDKDVFIAAEAWPGFDLIEQGGPEDYKLRDSLCIASKNTMWYALGKYLNQQVGIYDSWTPDDYGSDADADDFEYIEHIERASEKDRDDMFMAFALNDPTDPSYYEHETYRLNDYLRNNPDFMRRLYLRAENRAKRDAKGDAVRAIALLEAQLGQNQNDFAKEKGFMNDAQFVIEAAKRHKYLQKDQKFPPILKNASEAMRKNRHVVSSVTRRDWRNLIWADEQIVDANIAISAVTQHLRAFHQLPEEIQRDTRLVRRMLEIAGGLKVIIDGWKGDRNEIPKVCVDSALENIYL